MKRGVILLLITLGLIAYLISPAKAAPSKSLIPLTPPLSAANPALITTAETARLTLTPTLELTATGSVQVITGRLEVTEAQQANPWRTYARTDCLRDLAVGQEVWVATCGGVLRWDQANDSYVHYTNADGLPDNDIQAIVVDLAGHIWVGTGPGGVSEFDGRTWLTHTVRDTEAGEYYDRAMAVDQAGHVWVNTTGGLNQFDGQKWTTHPLADNLASSSIRAIASDPAGNIWLGVYGGVSKFDGQGWTSYTTANGLVSDDVTALAVDSAGHIWVGTHSGVNVFDGQSWRTYTAADGLMDNRVTDIALDPAGQVWVSHMSQTVQTANGGFAREGGGVSRFDGQTWTTYTAAEGLAENSTRAVAVDSQGGLWFGGSEGVLSHLAGQQWTAYRTAGSLVSSDVFAITIDEAGDKWFGTRAGANKFDGQSWTSYTRADGLADDEVSAVAIDQRGQPWFGTWGGLSRFDGQTWTTYMETWINDVAVDQAGQLWVGTNSEGLSRFDGQNWQTYTTADGLASDSIEALTLDEAGHVWTGTIGRLNEFDGQRWTIYTNPATTGLVSGFITAIAAGPAGEVWAGTVGGVNKFDGQIWSTYTITNGLAGNHITSIAIDPAGHTWFAAYEAGVSEFDGCTWTTYTTADGLVSNQVTDIAIDRAGHKWFATTNGVSELNDQPSPVTPTSDLADQVAVCTLLVGSGQPGRLYALVDASAATRLLSSDDFGQTWTPFPGDLPVEPACLRNISLDYATPDALYASTCRGLYRWSTDEWTLISPQLTEGVAIVYQQPERLWAVAPAATTEAMVLYSDTGGQTWDWADEGLAEAKGITALALDPRDSSTLYALVQFPKTGTSLYRGKAGTPWLALPSPLPNTPLNSGLALDGAKGALYVTTGSQLWRSSNPAAPEVKDIVWELVHGFGPDVQAELLASGWSPEGLALYANLTNAGEGRPVLYRSLDGGQTWGPLAIIPLN